MDRYNIKGKIQKNSIFLPNLHISKDLTRITMPVLFCEPLSFLQRTKESVQYAELLNKAFDELDPAKRMALVTAFAMCPLASLERFAKPFNPLLGETYEIIRFLIFFNNPPSLTY